MRQAQFTGYSQLQWACRDQCELVPVKPEEELPPILRHPSLQDGFEAAAAYFHNWLRSAPWDLETLTAQMRAYYERYKPDRNDTQWVLFREALEATEAMLDAGVEAMVRNATYRLDQLRSMNQAVYPTRDE